jgi:transposase InsO family protein
MNGGTELAVERMCALGQVSRAGWYRYRSAERDGHRDADLRAEIRKIALEWPCYGSRRVARELRDRGWKVNRKRIQRWMREDHLLCVRKRAFRVTTNSRHGLPVYANLAAGMTLTGLDQLWVADITYIRLEREFVYLAVILDAYSRRVVGWALECTLEDTLTLAALRLALERRRPAPGLLHHSDRGVQYASRDYTALLQEHGLGISMSRKGNPYDNATCESFLKTLKYEEVYRSEYRDLGDARARIGEFLEAVYNERRLHSALGYLSPARFERALPVPVSRTDAPGPAAGPALEATR